MLKRMKALDILTAYCCLMCLFAVCHSKRGFILTAPKAVDAGSTEYFTFTAFDVPQGGQVTIKLLHGYTNETLSESKLNVINNINMWMEMAVPPLSTDLHANLKVEGTFSDGYRIDAVKEVIIRHNSVLAFIQTDKPVYKPGQTVRFRILPMNSQLIPLLENAVADVWIEDPSGIRVAQWKEIKFPEGMVQLDLPLSNEPPLGTWKIQSKINQVSSTQKFNVEKYVLPKFDVKINPPDFVMADLDILPVEVCAWYTYGKKVEGTLKTKVTYKKYSWEGNRRPIPSVEHTGLISGCETFRINTQDILLQSREFGFRTIEVFAEVVENETEIMGNASTTVEITHSALSMKFLSAEGETDFFDYLKPGIPFYGQLHVTKPDGSPAVSEKVEICATYQRHQDTNPSPMPLAPGIVPLPIQHRPFEKRCHMFTSNKKGLIRFTVPPKSQNITKISIVAEAVNYYPQKYNEYMWQKKIERPEATLDLRPWYSPSNSYLQIQPLPGEMECEKLLSVKIRYTAKKGVPIKFYHQVLSRGRIVQQGSHQRTFYSKEGGNPSRYDLGDGDWSSRGAGNSSGPPEIGEFLLSFDPRATMSPVARLLVFYVQEDGEIVADSRKFRISPCFLNKVNLHFRHEQQYPSTEVSMLLSASPSSVCGITLVDKSVRLLKPENQFKKEKIFEAMEKYDVGRSNRPHQVTEDYCVKKEAAAGSTTSATTSSFDFFSPSPGRPMPIPLLTRSTSLYVDTSMAFEEAGMVVITNFELETRPCLKTQPTISIWSDAYIDMYSPRGLAPETIRNSVPLARSPGYPQVYDKRPLNSPHKEETPKEKPKDTEEIRNYFPETWLWEMHTLGSNGEMALNRRLPHTITQWVGSAVCVHPKAGLGMSDISRITAFQPFFLSYRLPYSVVRGEVLPLVVSVFNYLSECLPIKLNLDESDEYEIFSESRSHTMCVCGGQSKSHRFILKPVALGKVNITVYGFSLEDDDAMCGNEVTARLSARDAVSKQLLVEAEGFPKEEVFNYYVCPENSNGSYAVEVDLLLPEDVVEGSGRAYASVTGDLMGPALNGLRGLVKLPVGCGEQNMVLFTPNIFVMDYLTATGRITDEIKTECLNNMRTGYQRELQYRHKDGSYSAFGPSDAEGSLWLTAFVLRSFGQARRFVSVDEHDLRLSTFWIIDKQFENGCFEPSGRLLNKAMKGGLNEGEHSLSPLTAYVLISLLEAGVQRSDQPAVRSALKCMEAEANPSSYSLALFAYAASLAKDTAAANRYLKFLDDRAIDTGPHKFWDSGIGGSKSVSVETAGYYLLARIELSGKEVAGELLSVVRWITQQRNSNGGFVSTQDTVVALQALASYSALQSKSALDMGLVVESDELVKGFKLEEKNKLVTQTTEIPVLPAVIDLQAVGEGCALVQFSLRYNVEKILGSEAFDLNIDAVRLGSSSCNLPRIGICMRYKLANQVTNMVVVSIKMASGFTPDEWSLYQLQSDPEVKLKRHEVDGNQVNLYFNELTNEQKCFLFFIKSEMEVEDIKPASVKLYDYYQPELQITKEYAIPSACTVSALPEMPRLPPLIIDTEDVDDLDNQLAQPSEEDEPIKLDLTPVDNENTRLDTKPENTEVIYHTDTTESLQTNGTTAVNMEIYHDTTLEGSRTSFSPATNESEKSMTTGDLFFNATVNSSELSVDHTTVSTDSSKVETMDDFETQKSFETANYANHTATGSTELSNQIELADDSSLYQTDSSHLSNFVNVDEELQFPDGVEGNVPVSVLRNHTSAEPILLNCPVCEDDLPSNFTELYCNAAFALKVVIREDREAKILQDHSWFLPHSKSLKKFARLEYGENCSCQQLNESGSIHLIIGTPAGLWNSDSEKHTIHLTTGVHVFRSPPKMAQLLKRTQSSCNSDP